MFILALCFLFGSIVPARSEEHALTYIYTGLSGGERLPAGARAFTAMGVLDGQVIDYYDSLDMRKVPKQPWMARELGAPYWDQGSLSRRSKQQWFKVNVDILLGRVGHNRSDLHVLQWLHGCRGDLRPDGTVAFAVGVDTYSYDGRDFLSFDYKLGQWVAAAPVALETKRKWDEVQLLKDYTRAYLDHECIKWMTQFLRYRSQQTQRAPPPSLDVFARETRGGETLLLTCLASGFPRKDAAVEIRRDGRTLTKEDGVTRTGARPNQDDTFQSRVSVEVLRSDGANFTCVLRRPADGLWAEALWDKEELKGRGPDVAVAAAVCSALLALAVSAAALGLRLYRKLKGGSAPSDKTPASFRQSLLMPDSHAGQSSSCSVSSASVSTSNESARDDPDGIPVARSLGRAEP